MRNPWSLLSVAPVVCAVLAAAETPPAPLVTEMELERAQLLAHEGETHAALLVALRVLREGPDEELREGGRHALLSWGLTAQELLTVDPTTMKPEEFDALCERVANVQALQRRSEIEMNYCEQLVHCAVRIGRGRNGRFTVDVNEADLARALSGFIQVVFTMPSTQATEEAQRHLERMNCVGAKLEAARKSLLEGKLPVDVKDEITAAACLGRLQEYREWMDSEENDGEGQVRKSVARQLGTALFLHCEENFQGTAALRREHETVGYWRSAARVPADF